MVVSNETGSGKTAISAAISRLLDRAGKKATVVKPFYCPQNGGEADTDGESYKRLLGIEPKGWPIELHEKGLTPKPLKQAEAIVEGVSQGADLVVVEGSRRLSKEESGKLAEALDAKVLVVVAYKRGLKAAELAPWQDMLGDRLVGFVVNSLPRYLSSEASAELLPSFESAGLVCFGLVPEDRTLLGVTVAQLAEHLDARFIACEEHSDALVEHLLVGGMSMDPAEVSLGHRENKAVIVRGDRPDIQMGALNTSTACLVLTKGVEPIEYVKFEAEQEEVSVMVVNTDTLETMDALNDLINKARFDHPRKLDRLVDLIEENVDTEALLAGIGVTS